MESKEVKRKYYESGSILLEVFYELEKVSLVKLYHSNENLWIRTIYNKNGAMIQNHFYEDGRFKLKISINKHRDAHGITIEFEK